MSFKKRMKNSNNDIMMMHFDDDDLTNSEDELSDSEKKLLEKVRRKRTPENFDSEDEVFQAKDSDDDDGDDDEDKNDDEEHDSMDSDLDQPEDDDMPDDRAWGKRRKDFYNTDYVDPDYSTTNEKDMAAAEAEEREAIRLQERLAAEMDDADFGLEFIKSVVDKEKPGDDDDEIVIVRDLSKLSKNQKIELFQTDNPEFELVVNDFKDRLIEITQVVLPFLNLAKKLNVPDCLAINYIKTRYQITLNYCFNISFYLILKAKQISVTSHPVIKRIAQYRQLLNQLDEGQGHLLEEASEILEAYQAGKPLHKVHDTKSEKSLNQEAPKRKLAAKHNQIKKKKTVKFTEDADVETEVNASHEDDDDAEEEMDAAEVDEDEGKEDADAPEEEFTAERRPITYEISKNKGLMPYRKKELRNPRVKHRIKYRKAIIRRKGAVREVRKEVNRYAGEMSGIKASVKKGIKLK